MHRFDILIVGASLVGASLACALRESGLAIGLAGEAGVAPPPSGAWDQRVYAVSPGSVRFLESVGAWERIDPARVAAVEAMHVYGDGDGARLDFDAYEAGVAQLCSIVESCCIQAALDTVLDDAPQVARLPSGRLSALDRDAGEVVVRLGDRAYRTRLLVAADGADSAVRAAAGIDVTERDYGQMGVVAHFDIATPHLGIARQWLRRDGVLALLPLPGNRVSMVWSTWTAQAQRLLALDAVELEREVSAATGECLGALRIFGAPAGFPLRLRRSGQMIGARVALVGDAAHQVHPLAGQGLNLGFGDAQALAGVLAGRGAQDDCGDRALLRRYERARREAVATMQWTTDGLQRLFNNDDGRLAWLRNTGLKLTERLPMIKTALIRQALG